MNAPKGVLSDSLRAQIIERKPELLKFLSDKATQHFFPPPIIPRNTSDPAPLSFAQERLWFLEQLDPGKAVYNICRAYRLIGRLNVSALEAGLNEIVRRHEVLRSAIRPADGRAAQIAQPPFDLTLSVTDLQQLAAGEREREVSSRIQQAANTPFDFSAGRFLRAALLRVKNDEHILILTTHHIVSDAWSLGILTRELWSLYAAYAAGEASPPKELKIQYADFAVWQRAWLQKDVLEAQVSYWKRQLTDLSHLKLTTDRSRPARQSFHAARYPIILREALTAKTNESSNESGVTPFMTLLTAFKVLLYRYSGQDDIVVGSPMANRARTELEPLIGFFVNTLVLRSDLSGNPTFRELLVRVREVCLGAYVHQDLPFEKLVQELQPERDQSRNPLFQVMFVLQNATQPSGGIPGVRIEPIETDVTRSPFALSLFLREREKRYIGYIEYSTDLFDRDCIERMVGHFQILLEAIVTNPDQPISILPILTEVERYQILIEWNDTAADYPKDKCIHQLFEKQAERTPEAIAVAFDDHQITYRELNRRSNQLAHYLISLGIGPENLVGICVERSIEMVVGLLAILKSGGAYVPLDPAYPKERLRFMLQDAQAPVLLTTEKLIEDRGWMIEDGDSQFLLPGSGQASIFDPRLTIICLDRDWALIAWQKNDNPKQAVNSQNLAYIIYTSGSTGTPKGVAIEHRNTVALLHWANSVFTNDELAGVLASTSICFDLSVFELFVPLSWGGTVVLAENAVRLYSMPEKNAVTLINTVPSVMTEMLAMGNLPASVRTVNLAGEPLPSELVNRIYGCATVERVYDLYGPSETTTYSTFTLRTVDGPVTIGHPIANTKIYILDGNLQSVPTGITGEIYIGGAGVARGYVNRSDLTAARFISSPFNANGGERIYRTGDLARYRPDRDIEFLGRTDNQLKIRGYRIEPGETEAVLTKHPTVKDCVVVACECEAQSGKNLVGYVVPRDPSVFSVTELRRYLKEKLPEYMVPLAFVMLDTLPVLPNGKVDRRQLPSPDYTRPQLNEEFVAPRTEIEELIAQTWQEVLKIENVGIFENLFELGGHSLLAIQIVSRLQEAFNKEVPLRILFDAPTIAELGQELEMIIRDGHVPELPPIVRAPRGCPLPLSVNQGHLWTVDQKIPGTHLFNMPYVYRLSGDLDVAALEKALGEIIQRHEALRTVFAEVDGRPVQIIKDSYTFQLPTKDLRGGAPDDVSQQAAVLLLKEREQPFDLATGPLFRVKLLRLTDSESFLLVTMHHIIGDHWSMQVFRRELVGIYEAYCQGRHSPFGGLPFQFADHAAWEKGLLESRLLDGQREYWKQQLAGPLPELEFKKSPARNKELSFRTSRQPIELDENLFMSIKAVARRESCTPFMMILAALDLVLYVLTGQEDIRIGTLVANRRQREAESAIGHFLNTVVLRTKLSPNLSCRQLLRQVREITLAAYAHQELPFEQLARLIETEKKIKRGSLFQVLLSYRKADFQPVNLPGLTFAPLSWQLPMSDSEVTVSACDLIVNLKETSTKLIGSVNYKTGTFDNDVIASMIERFYKVLQKIAVDVEKHISMFADDLGA